MNKVIVKLWKLILGYFFSKGPVSSFRLKYIITDVINKFKDAGFIPKVIICDQGTNNIGMRNLFGATQTQLFINFKGENIYFFHDSPHLIKSVRNNLKKYNFSYDNDSCSWSDLANFYNLDKNKKPRLAPLLNKIHMDLPPFSPNVCFAIQTLSHYVSSGKMTLISLNEMKSSAIHTERFIEFFDNLFDVLNSITHSEAKTLRKLLIKTSVENVFSVVRSKGDNNVTPDATKFHSAIRMCMCNTLLEPS